MGKDEKEIMDSLMPKNIQSRPNLPLEVLDKITFDDSGDINEVIKEFLNKQKKSIEELKQLEAEKYPLDGIKCKSRLGAYTVPKNYKRKKAKNGRTRKRKK